MPAILLVRVVFAANFDGTLVLFLVDPNPKCKGCTIQQTASVRVVHPGSFLMEPSDHLTRGVLIATLVLRNLHMATFVVLSGDRSDERHQRGKVVLIGRP
jgi:hypothetical protein